MWDTVTGKSWIGRPGLLAGIPYVLIWNPDSRVPRCTVCPQQHLESDKGGSTVVYVYVHVCVHVCVFVSVGVCGVYMVLCTVLFHKVCPHFMCNLCVMCIQAHIKFIFPYRTYQVYISIQDISSYSEAAKSGTEAEFIDKITPDIAALLVSSPTHLDHVILILVAMSICC